MRKRWTSLILLALLSSSSAAEKSLFDSTALSGEWGGFRSPDSGVTLKLGYTQEILGVVAGGIRRHADYDALASIDLKLDLEKLVGWRGGTFRATGFGIIGSSLTSESVGSDCNVSNINYRNSVRLYECYLDQTLLEGRLSFRVGELAVDSEFFGSEIGDVPGGGLFFNSDFGALPIVSFNAPCAIYAIAAPGFRIKVAPTDSSYIQMGVYDGNPAPDLLGDPSPGFQPGRHYNDHGLDIHLASSEGAFLIGEAGFTTKRWPGSYKLGAFYHTDDFTRWRDGSAVSGIWAAYAIAGQKLWNEKPANAQGLYFFARGSMAPQNRARLEWAGDAGFDYVGAIPGRDQDILGIGFSVKNYSRDFSAAQQRAGQSAVEVESVLELTYQIEVAPCITVQPDLQYVIQPGGHVAASNAVVLGLRVSTLF